MKTIGSLAELIALKVPVARPTVPVYRKRHMACCALFAIGLRVFCCVKRETLCVQIRSVLLNQSHCGLLV
jgi:hypothetical protein